MDRSAVFVDAGYLIAAGGNLVLGEPRRQRLSVKSAHLANMLIKRAQEHGGLPLLRLYWYDGGRGMDLTDEQRRVKDLPLVKLRLGQLTAGAQKGVDARIFRDMTNLARQRAICTAYLISGDGDMVEAVSLAQELGIQVVLISVIPAGNSRVSQALIDEVDLEDCLEKSDLQEFFEIAIANPDAGVVL